MDVIANFSEKSYRKKQLHFVLIIIKKSITLFAKAATAFYLFYNIPTFEKNDKMIECEK